jgi:phosphatidylserine/phosphatidylglycerophosphate/cardiolipin synthase-like enzyme
MRKKSLCFVMFLFSLPLVAQDHSTVELKKVSVPVDLETCFSPDEPCSDKLVKFINSAEKTLDIAIYSINLENVVDALIKKAEKTKVRIVCDKVQAHGVKSKVKHLLEAGVNIRYGKQKGIMHDKFVIVDNKMIETGSFNYTNHASIANQENQVYLAGKSVVRRFIDRFDLIWESSVEINLIELNREIELELKAKEIE